MVCFGQINACGLTMVQGGSRPLWQGVINYTQSSVIIQSCTGLVPCAHTRMPMSDSPQRASAVLSHARCGFAAALPARNGASPTVRRSNKPLGKP